MGMVMGQGQVPGPVTEPTWAWRGPRLGKAGMWKKSCESLSKETWVAEQNGQNQITAPLWCKVLLTLFKISCYIIGRETIHLEWGKQRWTGSFKQWHHKMGSHRERENTDERCIYTCIDMRVYISMYVYTHIIRRLAGLPLHFQLHNVLFSHFRNTGHFTSPKDVLYGMRAVHLPNGAAKGSFHLFDCLKVQVLYQVLYIHYLVYSCNNRTIRITVASWRMRKLRLVEVNELVHSHTLGYMIAEASEPGSIKLKCQRPSPLHQTSPTSHPKPHQGSHNSDSVCSTEIKAINTYAPLLFKVRWK